MGQREGNSTGGNGDNIQARTGIGIDAVRYENKNEQQKHNEENRNNNNTERIKKKKKEKKSIRTIERRMSKTNMSTTW